MLVCFSIDVENSPLTPKPSLMWVFQMMHLSPQPNAASHGVSWPACARELHAPSCSFPRCSWTELEGTQRQGRGRMGEWGSKESDSALGVLFRIFYGEGVLLFREVFLNPCFWRQTFLCHYVRLLDFCYHSQRTLYTISVCQGRRQ